MDIKCPHCSRVVQAENINIQSCIAKCGYCNAVFGFADKVPGAAPASSKRTVEMPKNYTMENEGVDLVLTRRWFVTENTPETKFACIPAIVRSISRATTPSSVTLPFFTTT